jgi:hypothetical protein
MVGLIRSDPRSKRSSLESGGSARDTVCQEEPSKPASLRGELCREVVTMVQSAETGHGMNPAADSRTALGQPPRWGVRQPKCARSSWIYSALSRYRCRSLSGKRDSAGRGGNPGLGDAVLPCAAEGACKLACPQSFCGRDDISARVCVATREQISEPTRTATPPAAAAPPTTRSDCV